MKLKSLPSAVRCIAFAVTAVLLVVGVSITALYRAPAANAALGQWTPNVITKMDSANSTTCAIADNKVFCWGRNNFGQLGIGGVSPTSVSLPTPVDMSGALAGKTLTDISISQLGSVCVVASGAAYCWGRNTFGQLGNGTSTDAYVPTAVAASGVLAGKTVTEVDMGDGHACVLASGAPYCWGVGANGRLGNGTANQSSVPVAVVASGALAGKTLSQISAGAGHTCVIGSGAPYCWGINHSGERGDGTTNESLTPVAVQTTGALAGKTTTTLEISNESSCALADQRAYCWGANGAGQLGNGTIVNSTVPVAVSTSGALNNKNLTQLSTGSLKACALDTAGQSYCWGNYAIGNGSGNATSSPAAVTTSGILAGIVPKSIISGSSANCIVGTNNRAYCWGFNANGELGDNTTTNRSEPVAVLAIDTVAGDAYRLYENTDTLALGTPLAATNTASSLRYATQSFRVRMAVKNNPTSATPNLLRANDLTLALQFAERTATTCSAQVTGFSDVTASSAIAWKTNSAVANGTTLSANSNDPVTSDTKVYQTYRSSAGTFTNSAAIATGEMGIWEFSLRDNNPTPATKTYCLKLVYSTPGDLESYAQYAEITTTAGSLDVGIVDPTGLLVGSPAFAFNNTIITSTCQSVTGTLGTSTQRIQVSNSASPNGWTLSIAPTGGATAQWVRADNAARYDFNDPSGAPAGCNSGSDGDGYAGQLTLDPSVSTLAAQSSCSVTGLTSGLRAAFSEGTTDAITLMSGSSSAQLGCFWQQTDVEMTQRIPANQPSGQYNLPMTMTVVAQ